MNAPRPNSRTSRSPAPAARRPGDCAPGARAGFTLVEMLVVMAIVAILTGMVLGALYTSAESARREGTQALVNKLHARLMPRYESYATRRVPIDPALPLPGDSELGTGSPSLGHEQLRNPGAISTGHNPEEDAHDIALRRLWSLRELMRIEMPDQYADITLIYYDSSNNPQQSEPLFTPGEDADNNNSTPPTPANALWASYATRLQNAMDALQASGKATNATNAREIIAREHQAAECLYMILTTPFGDEGIGSSAFSQRDVGDVDADGMPEFIDGWGNPIAWIRWPTAFASDLQPLAELDLDQDGKMNDRDADRDGDPLDVRGLDRQDYTDNSQDGKPRGYRLVPLVLSAGGDNDFGLVFRFNSVDGDKFRIDPYGFMKDPPPPSGDGDVAARATIKGGGEGAHLDNLHSHLLQQQ